MMARYRKGDEMKARKSGFFLSTLTCQMGRSFYSLEERIGVLLEKRTGFEAVILEVFIHHHQYLFKTIFLDHFVMNCF